MIVVADPGGAIRENWAIGDEIVLGSTDYLPGDAELLTISSKGVVVDPNNSNDSDINVERDYQAAAQGQYSIR